MKVTDFENSIRVKFFHERDLKAYDGHIMDGDKVVWKEEYVKWLENLVKINGVLDDVINCPSCGGSYVVTDLDDRYLCKDCKTKWRVCL